ncbi:hypothetical protein [Bradyrhizobium sp. WD16]|uniref:hypothetical protein n=1 Tax=Bradyrhizobium sp. WD16 TaxID=1521768 RepID=UPI0020A2BE5A|nr:hypothetical protein [Bradyrhizobium sp. WD16]
MHGQNNLPETRDLYLRLPTATKEIAREMTVTRRERRSTLPCTADPSASTEVSGRRRLGNDMSRAPPVAAGQADALLADKAFDATIVRFVTVLSAK